MTRAPRTTPPPPSGAPDARILGAILLIVLALLAIGGAVLALNYAATPEEAHTAVTRITDGPLAWARGLHAWAASFALALVVVHAARAYASGRLRVPGRRATLSGLAALALLVGASLSGSILSWDQQGWESFEHLAAGLALAGLTIGDGTPAGAPLDLLFLGHVLALPLALGGLVLLHLRRGTWKADAARVMGLLRRARIPIAAVAIALLGLALLAPPALGPAPIDGLSVARPDWPFLWLVPLQDAFGPPALLALPLVLLLAAAALLRAPKEAPRHARLVILAIAGLWLLLTLLGARA